MTPRLVRIAPALALLVALAGPKPAHAQNEARIRYILADITLSGDVAYYRAQTRNIDAVGAILRWDSGVRVVNASQFERRLVEGNVFITYAGTDQMINGMDVRLTSDGGYLPPSAQTISDQQAARYLLVATGLAAVLVAALVIAVHHK